MLRVFLLIFFGTWFLFAQSQNLPSLLTEKNINATFAIAAYDAEAKEWGIAVATNNLYVGNSTIYIQPGVGAIAVIAETEPAYGIKGLQQLQKGKTPQQVIQEQLIKDEDATYRQVCVIDSIGNSFAYTGNTLTYWKGVSSHKTGKGYAVMGNQLAPHVLDSLAIVFEQTKGTLAQRLTAALVAGQHAGGQINGKQSCAVMVKGSNNEWFNQIDFRVDNSHTPFEDLQKLLNYHYGRIRLNQAIYQVREGRMDRGVQLLQEGEKLVSGWTGIYGKIVTAYLLLHQDSTAVQWIQRALREVPEWRENLPAFYCLKDAPGMQGLIQSSFFTAKDWMAAIQQYQNLGLHTEAINLAKQTLQQYPLHSYIWYLLGKSYKVIGYPKDAASAFARSLQLDPANLEARL
ncbi:Uncharacterized conserved protein, Ntn-hydrolase superfamily [Filimonas lacunae]|uniref:Uncharacterized conserved protein, Ntn-hydrolase superfamily n=1 Tax=Filimonas lacunae TaxID=477680 RepID=A0A173MQK7_9BACT|nr:DUF1028 domain-containing protein [Filimonas lacunae]BAV09934.1 hypothetical protein FLA_5987 [Filimonas lacunae]SIS81328.1 Uncharacterized conserved protein, Ntn-hydrolase superfamily [Filimonas lacunae]